MNAHPTQCQQSSVKDLSQHKSVPSRILSLEDEILMTLMRIRIDCPVEDLAFRIGVSVNLATSIITTSRRLNTGGPQTPRKRPRGGGGGRTVTMATWPWQRGHDHGNVTMATWPWQRGHGNVTMAT